MDAFHTRCLYVPNQELLNKVDKPLVRDSRPSGRLGGAESALQSRDELHARALELNKRWTIPYNREVAARCWKIGGAYDEIKRLNVEARRLYTQITLR